jgi:hypothetical protein
MSKLHLLQTTLNIKDAPMMAMGAVATAPAAKVSSTVHFFSTLKQF